MEDLLAACRTDRTPEDRRAMTADALLTSLRPWHARLGITRVGLLTGLDRVGVPVAFACRPNSRTLSVHLGRGLDPAAAMASAAMEAVEAALAECRPADLPTATLRSVRDAGARTIDFARTLRCRPERLEHAGPLAWVDGVDLVTGRIVTVPWDLVGLDHTATESPFDRASDGLGAGTTWPEAVLQGLLELVERDAAALSSACPAGARRRIAAAAFEDPSLDEVARRVAEAGLVLDLFDETSDIGLPVIAARVRTRSAVGRPLMGVDICGGWGCDARPATAALKAVTEALQARAAGIAGARDDILPAWYRSPAPDLDNAPDGAPDVEPEVGPETDGGPIPPTGPALPRSDRIDRLLARLQTCGAKQVVAVPLGNGSLGVRAVRVIIPGLEVGLETGRPGARLLAALIRRAA